MEYLDRFRLNGRIALVTGGGRGLGVGISSALAGAGADIVIVSRKAEEMAGSISTLEHMGRKVWAFSCDLSDVEGIPALYDKVISETGGVDILVNNAGGTRRGRAEELPMEDFNHMLDLNLKSVFAMSQAFGRERIAAKKPGKIINIASLMCKGARPTTAAYGAAKAGASQLTMSFAVEWAQYGINVNAIGPGYIESDLNKPLMEDAEFSEWVRSKTPLDRWGKPEDLGGAAVFLASSASDFITGQTIYVDGGWLAAL